jgi:hypothetical protein
MTEASFFCSKTEKRLCFLADKPLSSVKYGVSSGIPGPQGDSWRKKKSAFVATQTTEQKGAGRHRQHNERRGRQDRSVVSWMKAKSGSHCGSTVTVLHSIGSMNAGSVHRFPFPLTCRSQVTGWLRGSLIDGDERLLASSTLLCDARKYVALGLGASTKTSDTISVRRR